MDEQIQTQLKILRDSDIQRRLDDIGRKIAASSDRQDLTYQFRIVQDNELNAFAIPGGFVYVHSGLMNISTDDELACILGHEIGHIAARHSVKKLQAVMAYEIIRSIAVGVTGKETIAKAVDIFIFDPATMAYSRQDELLADRLSIRYAKRSGFNPFGLITFFEKLKAERDSKGPNLRIEILSSHPDLEERIRKVKEEIALNP